MKNFDEMRAVAQKYINEKKENDTILFDPVPRVEDDKLCLMYCIVTFNDEDANDYRIKRPTEWFTQDLETGNILNYYHIEEYDFARKKDLEIDSLFENTGKSIVYDYNNFVTSSFKKWMKQIKDDVLAKTEDTSYELDKEEVLQVSDDLISPRDYVLANLDDSLAKMYDILFYDLGNAIRDAYSTYYSNLFTMFRNEYVNNKKIDKVIITKYLNLIKYLWPESYKLINKMTNIEGVIDQNFDKKIDEMLAKKTSD